MLDILIVAVTLVCAIQAIRAKRLLHAALWLAGTSALVALLLYLLGAYQVAVIELSVGAGLVTVLFVFAINIAGEEAIDLRSLLPRPLAWGLIGLAVVLLGVLIIPSLGGSLPQGGSTQFGQMVWGERRLDTLLQVVLIFSGVMGVLGLLSEDTRKEKHS
jgi:uncharacterized MnhB-related membrane protein